MMGENNELKSKISNCKNHFDSLTTMIENHTTFGQLIPTVSVLTKPIFTGAAVLLRLVKCALKYQLCLNSQFRGSISINKYVYIIVQKVFVYVYIPIDLKDTTISYS